MAYTSWSVVFGEQPSAAKWNILGANDASFNDGSGIAVSAITPEKLLTGTGTTWPWTAWTPTYTNLTVGNGTHQSYYKQVGKTVVARVGFTLGNTSSVGTAPTFTLPITSSSNYTNGENIGGLRMVVAGAGYVGYVQWATSTTALLLAILASGTYAGDANFGASTPAVWITGNTFHGTIIYEAA